jgi:hypothetical protein
MSKNQILRQIVQEKSEGHAIQSGDQALGYLMDSDVPA